MTIRHENQTVNASNNEPVVATITDESAGSEPHEEPRSPVPASERDSLKTYLNEIGRTPLLTPEQETVLALRVMKGDPVARESMIKANLRLVVRIARDYERYGLPLPDLISEGNIGLIKAIERFDPAKGGKLSTYAAWWIRQALRRALATHGKTIRLPMHLVDRIAGMRRIINRLQDELHREPTDDEIALVMEIPVRKIVHMKTVAARAASLDAPAGIDGESTFGDFIGDDSQCTPVEALRDKNAAEEIRGIVDRLDPREAEIIRLRFGLGGEAPMTLEQVGALYHLTRERIRQVEHTAIMKLRRLMADRERRRDKKDLREEAILSARQKEITEYLLKKAAETGKPERRFEAPLHSASRTRPQSPTLPPTPVTSRKDAPAGERGRTTAPHPGTKPRIPRLQAA